MILSIPSDDWSDVDDGHGCCDWSTQLAAFLRERALRSKVARYLESISALTVLNGEVISDILETAGDHRAVLTDDPMFSQLVNEKIGSPVYSTVQLPYPVGYRGKRMYKLKWSA